MKIIQFLHGNQMGGMEKFCIDISNELVKRHKVMIIADSFFKPFCSNEIIFKVLDIHKSRNNILFLYNLYNTIVKFNPDIIHVHKQKSIQILNRLRFFLNIPFIATKHDMQQKKAFYGLKYAVSISKDMDSTISAKNLYHIYNGILPTIPQKIKLKNNAFNIVAVGGLRKVKNFDKLIKSVANLSFNYHLTILGSGDEYEYLQQLIYELNIQEYVTLKGFCDNVADYLYSADLQVISSYSEGFSLAMIEGIFYSPILISTKVSGANDILPKELLYDISNLTDMINIIYKNQNQYKQIFNKVKNQYMDILNMNYCSIEYEKVYHLVRKDYHEK